MDKSPETLDYQPLPKKPLSDEQRTVRYFAILFISIIFGAPIVVLAYALILWFTSR
jgi:hypothetical protein